MIADALTLGAALLGGLGAVLVARAALPAHATRERLELQSLVIKMLRRPVAERWELLASSGVGWGQELAGDVRAAPPDARARLVDRALRDVDHEVSHRVVLPKTGVRLGALVAMVTAVLGWLGGASPAGCLGGAILGLVAAFGAYGYELRYEREVRAYREAVDRLIDVLAGRGSAGADPD